MDADSPNTSRPDEVRVHVSLAEGRPVLARALTLSLQRIRLGLESTLDVPPADGDIVRLSIESPLMDLPVDAICKITSIERGATEDVYSVDVLDWLGIVDQLPKPMRSILSMREDERLTFDASNAPDITLELPGIALDATVSLKDVSPYGLSVRAPAAWTERVQHGERARVQWRLPEVPGEFLAFGFVRSLTPDDQALTISIVFDPNATLEYADLAHRLRSAIAAPV